MFVRKSTYDAALAGKDAEIADLAYKLVKEEERANRIAGKLTEANKIAAKVPNLEAENHRLQADIAGLLPDAETYRAQKAKRCANLTPGGKPHKKRANGAPATH